MFCKCGCGQKTRIAKQTATRLGHHKGEPVTYILGHNNRGHVERFCKGRHDKTVVGTSKKGACKACTNLRARIDRIKNPEASRMKINTRRAENPEKRRKQERENYARNIQTRRIKSKKETHIRRIKKNQNGIGLDIPYDIDKVVNQATHCGLCKKRYKSGDQRELDHIIPISLGGADSLENVQSVHAICNKRKQNKIFERTQYPLGFEPINKNTY